MTGSYNPSLISSGIIDVYHGDNGDKPIAWDAVVRANPTLRAVIAKATQGDSFVDPMWFRNRAGVTSAGLLIGAYHFCDGSDPDEQVAHFLATVGDLRGVLLALDWEPNTGAGGTATVAQVEQMVVKMRTTAQRSPLIYCGRSMLDRPSLVLASCPLWLAEYGANPICPPGWDKWRLHQFTDRETITGIEGGVDASMHDDTQGSLAALWQQMGAPSPVLKLLQPQIPARPPVPAGAIKALQAALGVADDGEWGPVSEAAYAAWLQSH